MATTWLQLLHATSINRAENSPPMCDGYGLWEATLGAHVRL